MSRVVAMKSFLLASIVVSGTVLFAHHLRDEPFVAEVIDSIRPDQPRPDFVWPPKLDEPYPDLNLVDQTGNLTRLSDFKGQVILVEPIGLPCAACQAFCGGHQVGGFRGVEPQPGLPSIKESARLYGKFDLSDERIVKVYLLLYGMDMRAPTPSDARAWADHFGMDRSKNEIVLTGLPSMMGDQSFAMIPGVHLVDRNFILCVDSAGRSDQTHDLYRDLLPRARALHDGSSNPHRRFVVVDK